MTNKSYYEIKIKDPTSLQHIVWLHPGQRLWLSLTPEKYPHSHVELNGKYLRKRELPETSEYEFESTEVTRKWSEYSNCYLGDVWIKSDGCYSRLILMQHSANVHKKRVVTVINPDCVDIKIKSHHVLEVIVYDMTFNQQDEWVWDWVPKQDIQLESLGSSVHYMHRWGNDLNPCDQNHLYATLQREEQVHNTWCRQHHFWFRIDASAFKASLDYSSRLEHIGDLKFFGYRDRFYKKLVDAERMLSVYLDLKKLSVTETENTLALKHLKDYTIPVANCGAKQRFVREPVKRKPQVRNVEFKLLNSVGFDGKEGWEQQAVKEEVVPLNPLRSEICHYNALRHPMHGFHLPHDEDVPNRWA